MKRLAAAALLLLLPACSDVGPRTLTVRGETLEVEHLREEPHRKYGIINHSMLLENRAVLSSWDRARHLHYFTLDAEGSFDVAFLDAAGKVVGLASLGRRDEKGVTSVDEAVRALFLREGWIARHGLAVGDVVQLSPAVAGEAPAAMVKLAIDGATVWCETAATGAERQRGLMHRPRMSADDGMLFIYPDADQRNFWMKNTLIGLDIAYFDGSGKLLTVCPRDPAADPERDGDKVTAPSEGKAQFVLEVNKGWFQRKGITDAGGRILKDVTIDIPGEARKLAVGGY